MASAISSGAQLPSTSLGIPRITIAQSRSPAGGSCLVIGVLTWPGQIALTVMPLLAHSLASSWVNQCATRAKASASALYLVFYYVGASTGGLYLQPFWQWLRWPGVVIGALLMYSLTLGLCFWLWQRAKRLQLC